ncbi:MAG TPA: glycoside hydrolase family 38 C-terminal domain-containing protein [Gemmatimonadaceae bacterium]|nr:glycoside hydrolase family 38 C-terminal domain-containing protein [Gemmatimonadaceae bacterium]
MTRAPAATRPSLVVHVVSHTHWDREWYHLEGRFRQRLVALLDELLAMPAADAGSFLLDGQTVLLEDYLAVRPERREELSARLRSGALEAGPWYVLADELIPSDEALVRNLLAGREVLHRLGATAPPVLYSPDAFGHPASLPTLARGFELPLVVLWRGFGGPHWPAADSVRWRSGDGSSVVLHHLPPSGYEAGASLPVTAAEAADRWRQLRTVIEPRANAGVALLPNGADHHALQRDRGAAVAALAGAAGAARVIASSLSAFAIDLLSRSERAQLPEIAGELRDSYGYTWTLQGTLAARAPLKRRALRIERTLRWDVEPWVALAARRGRPSRSALAREAWKTLLRCYPHDTLCGCCIDGVARAMSARLEDAAAQAAGLRLDALHDLAGVDLEKARALPQRWHRSLVVRNPAGRARGGVAQVEIVSRVRHVPVGPGSASPAPTDPPVIPLPRVLEGGRPIAIQPLSESRRHLRLESPRAYPRDEEVHVTRALAWVPEVAGFGTTNLDLVTERGAEPAGPPSVARASPRWIENAALRVDVGGDGRVRLTERGGAKIPSLLYFEDVGDAGDLYTHSPIEPVIRAAKAQGVRVEHGGPLRAELALRYAIDVPAATERAGRSSNEVSLPLVVLLAVDAGSPLLRVRVRGTNRANDHRLRVVFATGCAGASVFADAAFGVVERLTIEEPPASVERVPPTAPLARYVSLFTAGRGVTLFSDGLAEYEVMPNGDLAVTLLRAVGELSREDLPERPGHAGWPASTPDAQSHGPFRADLALLLHGPRTEEEAVRIDRLAEDVLAPLTGETLLWAIDTPHSEAGVTLEGDGLRCAAVKESEDGAWMVLRAVNLTGHAVRGRWVIGPEVTEARVSALDEREGEALEVRRGAIAFEAPPFGVVTVLVR